MNCPSCGTEDFYEGMLTRGCTHLGCKLYCPKHAETCRKAEPPEVEHADSDFVMRQMAPTARLDAVKAALEAGMITLDQALSLLDQT